MADPAITNNVLTSGTCSNQVAATTITHPPAKRPKLISFISSLTRPQRRLGTNELREALQSFPSNVNLRFGVRPIKFFDCLQKQEHKRGICFSCYDAGTNDL